MNEEQANHGKGIHMDVRDESDDLEGNEEESGCPHCSAKDCKHRVLMHTVYNRDWDGSLAEESFDGTPESIEDCVSFQTYWLALVDSVPGSTIVSTDLDGGGPGTAETYVDVFFEKPAAGIKALLAAGKNDLEFLKSEVAAVKAKKGKKGRTRNSALVRR